MRIRRSAGGFGWSLAVTLLVMLAACSSPLPPDAAPTPGPSLTPAISQSPPAAEPPPAAGPVALAGQSPKAVITLNGIVAPVIGPAEGGVTVGTPCGGAAVVGQGTPIESAAVVLDPGHGGSEPGSVGPNGLTENALNLAVSKFAQSALVASGQPTVLTRTSDYRITLEARASITKSLAPRAFVSIHHNGDPDGPSQIPGTETYYQTVGASAAESRRLAGLIQEEVVRALSGFQGVAWVADRDAGAKYRRGSSGNDYYGILRRTQGVPAVLSEAAFLTNPPEAELLSRPDVQQAEGGAIARAIIRFITTQDDGSGFTEPYPREAPAGSGGGPSNCRDPQL